MSYEAKRPAMEFKERGFYEDPPGADALYAAVGRFVHAWSGLEALLDMALAAARAFRSGRRVASSAKMSCRSL